MGHSHHNVGSNYTPILHVKGWRERHIGSSPSYGPTWAVANCYPSFLALTFGLVMLFCNRMTISDYNTKPIHGDCAIILKLHGFT